MQACLQRSESQRCFIKDCILKTKFERQIQTLFYKVLSLISKDLFSNPISIFALCKQAPLALSMMFY
jgi:hypothetical protein